MSFDFLQGWWTDAGTFESLHRAANLVSETRQKQTESVGAAAGVSKK
jgi:glucose-1-phosphate thymidylyltransferase